MRYENARTREVRIGIDLRSVGLAICTLKPPAMR